jgi:hypothetical protein
MFFAFHGVGKVESAVEVQECANKFLFLIPEAI